MAILVPRSRPSWSTTGTVVLSLIVLAAGVGAIIAPFIAGIALTGVVGWLLMVGALVHLVFAWQGATRRTALWQVLLGVVYGVAGFYLVIHPLIGLASLTLALAAYLFVEAILEFVLAFDLRPAPGTGWLIVDAVITLVLAVLIWMTWPFSSAWALGTLVGISMILSGISRLMLGRGRNFEVKT